MIELKGTIAESEELRGTVNEIPGSASVPAYDGTVTVE